MLFGHPNAHLMAAKRSKRGALLAASLHYAPELSPGSRDDEPYLRASAVEIVRKLEKREEGWTAERVMLAYIRRARKAQEELNCLTEIMFEEALATARNLDAEFARSGKLKGALHGVPFSIKDHIDIAGLDSTTGFSAWINQPATKDATIVAIIREAGGIPFVKTNVPQTMMAFACENPVWGSTLNPTNKKASPGGSSGGEAALLGAGGSALGVGTDIGGSVRIPAHNCGIYALKPTAPRWSHHGLKSPDEGFESIHATAGPMGRSVEDLALLSRVLLDGQSRYWDAEGLVPVPWRDVELPRKLKVGFWTDDNFTRVSPACQRAVREAAEALRAQGHNVVEIPSPNMVDIQLVYTGIMSSSGHTRKVFHLGPDKAMPILDLSMSSARLPRVVRKIGSVGAKYVFGDDINGRIVAGLGPKSVSDHQGLLARRDDIVKKIKDELWSRQGFDCVLTPVHQIPAPAIAATYPTTAMGINTFLWNLVPSTVGVLPVTKVDPQVDALPPNWLNEDRPGLGKGSSIMQSALYAPNGHITMGRLQGYKPQEMAGQPVGVQVVGPAYTDERILAIMQVLDDALKGKAKL